MVRQFRRLKKSIIFVNNVVSIFIYKLKIE